MKYTIQVHSRASDEFVDITRKVQDLVQQSGVKEGICVLTVPHTTAGLSVNENQDSALNGDLLAGLRRLVPARSDYAHAGGNTPAHIKSCLVGVSETLQIEDRKLALGTWQGVFLAEFDGPRTRHVVVRIIADPGAS
jgi:secondary thiamine-phosphate synthase enzyme